MASNDLRRKRKRRDPPQFKTLSPLIRFFIGIEIGVEVKNGRLYHGFLQDSDDEMNLVLTTSRTDVGSELGMETTTMATSSRGDGEKSKDEVDPSPLGVFQFSKLHIRGSSIRFIHFPDNADLPALIKLGFDRKRAASDKYARGKRQRR